MEDPTSPPASSALFSPVSPVASPTATRPTLRQRLRLDEGWRLRLHHRANSSTNEPLLSYSDEKRPKRPMALLSMLKEQRDNRQDSVFTQTAQEEELKEAYRYPNPTLVPHFKRKHVTLIAISGAIGTGLFLGSGTPLHDAGPLGLLLGYTVWSSVVYGMVMSQAEMVAVYPYCRGTVGLADRFVDPALGFAMGWNAWYHWGIVIPSQIAAATALLKFWNPPSRLAAFWPPLFVLLTSGSVFGARIYGEVESVFAIIKLSTVVIIVILSTTFEAQDLEKRESLFQYWDPPMAQYLGIPGAAGRLLGFFAVFFQAAISYLGTEITGLIAGEVVDAPRVIADVSRRVWLRVTLMYSVSLVFAGILVPGSIMGTQYLIPGDPNSPQNDAPWIGSPFMVALSRAGSRYSWISNLCIAAFISSAASAASTEVFISSRYLYYLAEAGHAPRFFGAIWPNTEEAKKRGAVVPWVGVLMTVGFATLSFLAMRPHENTMSGMEKVFQLVDSMTTSACLLAWVGTLFTYLRFYWGTQDQMNARVFEKEIARIRENRAWGQPFWAIYSLVVCSFVLVFNGWSLFNHENGNWMIYYSPERGAFSQDQVLKFVTTYLPIPMFIVMLFGYKLVIQTRMVSTNQMNFSGVAYVDWNSPPVEPRPKSFLGRLWWILVK